MSSSDVKVEKLYTTDPRRVTNVNKILCVTTNDGRRWDTTNHKRVIMYCEECNECQMIFESDTMTKDMVECQKHNRQLVRFVES